LYFDAGRNYKIGNIVWGGVFRPIQTFKPTIDWNLAAEYRINKQWTAFLELNNLLNRRHELWYNYGSYRMNFLLGATFNL
jgi:outer membrane receptor protein involved in Fe transport